MLYQSPVSTTRVDGPSWRVTGFHYPSTRAVETGSKCVYTAVVFCIPDIYVLVYYAL